MRRDSVFNMFVGGRDVIHLQTALRGEAAAEEDTAVAAEQAAVALIDALQGPLLRYCAGLVRGSDAEGAEAEALALTAWNQTLQHLADPQKERVPDGAHLWRILRNAARRAYLATTPGQAALAAAAAAETSPPQEEIADSGRTLGRRGKNPICPPLRRKPTRSLSPHWAALPGT